MNGVGTVWHKEVVDTLRDRRTLIVMLVVPIVLMPALFIVMGKITKWQVKESLTQEITIAIAGERESESIVASLTMDTSVKILSVPDRAACEAAVNGKTAACGLVIAPGFDDIVRQNGKGAVVLIRKGSEFQSLTAAGRVQSALSMWRERVTRSRLEMRNVDPLLLQPIDIESADLASEKEKGGFILGFILPMLLVMWALMGGMFTAIDVSAGEKERSTLETLIQSPASRVAIAIGKLGAIFTIAFGSIVVSMISFVGSFYLFPLELGEKMGGGGAAAEGGARIELTMELVILILGVSALLALAFAALQLAMGIYARTFKEAQNLINPLYLIVVMPVALLNAAPGFKPGPGWFAFPGVNAAFVFREALVGTYDPMHLGITVGTLTLFAAVSVTVAAWFFTREQVLFK